MPPSKELVELRDENGLDLTQRQFFHRRAHSLTDYDTLVDMGLPTLWLATQLRDSAFRRMYNQLFPVDPKTLTTNALKTLLPKVVGILDSALESDDPKRQAWATDRLLRVAGLEKVLVESTSVSVPFGVAIASQMKERGVEVPDALAKKLEEYGLNT